MRTNLAEVGKQFGEYTCISEKYELRKEGVYQRYRCKCGLEKWLKTSQLRWRLKRGQTCQCSRCRGRASFASNTSAQSAFVERRSRVAVGLLSGSFFQHIKHAAIHRGLEFNLTIEYLWSLFEEQRGLCAYSKVPIFLSLERKNKGPNFDLITASLDRKDSTKGYIEGNVQWVHKRVNQMKLDDSEEEFIEWCRKIVNS